MFLDDFVVLMLCVQNDRFSFNFPTRSRYPRPPYKLSLFNSEHEVMTTKEGAEFELVSFPDAEWGNTTVTFEDAEMGANRVKVA